MKKMKTGWNKVEYKPQGQLATQEFWKQGFFPETTSEGRRWKRNFTELRLRDYSLFALGDITNKSILDIGCGRGMYLETFLRMGASHIGGIDILPDYIEDAKKIVKELDADPTDIYVADCTDLPYDDNSFDHVFSGDVFEHITYETKDKCVAEIYRVLKPGGTVIIKTPNLNYLKKTLILKRLRGLLKGKNPFKIHIDHTRNNPDSEHHGLTTHKELTEIFLKNTFHDPENYTLKLYGRGLPDWMMTYMEKRLNYNETIIIKATKPIFLGLYQ